MPHAFPALAPRTEDGASGGPAFGAVRTEGQADSGAAQAIKWRRAQTLLDQKNVLGDLTPPHVELELRQIAHELGPRYPGVEALPTQPPLPMNRKALAEFHAEYYAQLQARLAGTKPDLSKVLARTLMDLEQARQDLAELGIDPDKYKGHFQPAEVQTPARVEEALELREHCITLMGIHLRRIDKLQETRLVLRDLTPSHLPLQIQTESASVERLRQQLGALGLNLGEAQGRAELGKALADQFGQQRARQLQRTLCEVPQGPTAFGPWEPEWLHSRTAGGGENAAQRMAQYELYRFHADYYDAMDRKPGPFDVSGASAEALRQSLETSE